MDFYCPRLKLAIEIDGVSHDFKGEYDIKRDNFFKTIGVEVLHIQDKEVKSNIEVVLEQIKEKVKKISGDNKKWNTR